MCLTIPACTSYRAWLAREQFMFCVCFWRCSGAQYPDSLFGLPFGCFLPKWQDFPNATSVHYLSWIISLAVGQVMAEEVPESAEGWRDHAEAANEEVPCPAALCQEALHHLHIHRPGGHPIHHLHRSCLGFPGVAW